MNMGQEASYEVDLDELSDTSPPPPPPPLPPTFHNIGTMSTMDSSADNDALSQRAQAGIDVVAGDGGGGRVESTVLGEGEDVMMRGADELMNVDGGGGTNPEVPIDEERFQRRQEKIKQRQLEIQRQQQIQARAVPMEDQYADETSPEQSVPPPWHHRSAIPTLQRMEQEEQKRARAEHELQRRAMEMDGIEGRKALSKLHSNFRRNICLAITAILLASLVLGLGLALGLRGGGGEDVASSSVAGGIGTDDSSAGRGDVGDSGQEESDSIGSGGGVFVPVDPQHDDEQEDRGGHDVDDQEDEDAGRDVISTLSPSESAPIEPTKTTAPFTPTAAPVHPSVEQTSTDGSIWSSYISSIAPDGGGALSDPFSPQSTALAWIVSESAFGPAASAIIDSRDDDEILRYARQLYAAATLYLASGGSTYWTENSNWMSDEDICSWYGITCSPPSEERAPSPQGRSSVFTNQGSRVRRNLRRNLQGSADPDDVFDVLDIKRRILSVDLPENNLRGPLPDEISLFEDAQSIRLYNNNLGPTLPYKLWLMKNLEELDLEHNSFSGTISSLVTAATNLEALFLSFNSLDGSIPPEIAGMQKLEQLWLHNNRFVDTIPKEIGEMSSLRQLFLEVNGLTGTIPPELGNLQNLTSMSLNDNQLRGQVPAEFGQLTSLHYLDLDSNELTGPLPQELANMKALQFLYVGRNDWEGDEIPSVIFDLTNLVNLGLESCQFKGALPGEQFSEMNDLAQLYLNGNEFESTIPPEFGELTSLALLSLAGNALTGIIPSTLGNLGLLEALYLGSNQLTGPLPPEMGRLGRLVEFSAVSNSLSGPLPQEIQGLTNLSVLALSQNGLGGKIRTEIGLLTALQTLALGENLFEGELPTELGLLTNLVELNLGDAGDVRGPIPSALSSLSSLRTLVLGRNKLSGEVPSSLWSDLGALEVLWLDYNSLTGVLPTTLGLLMPNLVDLRLNNNKNPDNTAKRPGFSGPIPPSLASLEKLETLFLQVNGFSDALPTDWTVTDRLESLRFENNELTGEASQSLCDLELTVLVSDCEVQCTCCTEPCAS